MATVTRYGQHRLADPNTALGAGEASLNSPLRSNLDYASALSRIGDTAEQAGVDIYDAINQGLDQFAATLEGLGFNADDVDAYVDFLKGLLTPTSPLDWSNLLGQIPDWLMPSSIEIGALTQQIVNRIADPTFTAAVDASSGRWTHDTVTFRSPDRSLKVSGTGQGTQLRSNIIKARAGQVVTVTINVAAKDLVGAGNDLLELNVLPYSNTGTDQLSAGSPIPIAHIGAPNGSVLAWTAMPNGAGGATLTGSWVVTGGFDGVALMFGVTDNLVGGDSWWDDAVMTLSGTTIPQGWITDLVNDGLQWSNDIANAQTWLTQIGQIFDNQVVTPINAWVQKIKDYWAGATGPAAVAANKAYQVRIAQNNAIIWGDALHIKYPLGSLTDTAATLVGGKRTWWGAVNDNNLAVAQMLGLAPPSTPTDSSADVGTFALNTQTRVVTNEATLSQVQAGLDALTTADTSVAGRKWVVPAHGGSAASWGPDWTVTATNSNIAPKSELDVYSMSLAASSNIDLRLVGRYANTCLTDDMIVSGVFYEAAQDMAGLNGPANIFKARMSADGLSYVFARVNHDNVVLGYTTNGAAGETVMTSVSSLTVPAGALVELQCGSSAGHRNYQVRVNGTAVITWPEAGTASQMGASYRGGGQDAIASHGAFNDTFAPARIRQFTLKDSNVAALTYGSSARYYRNTTSGIALLKGQTNGLNAVVLNAIDYESADIRLTNQGLIFYTPGRYLLNFGARFSAAWTQGMTADLVRATPGGPSILQTGQNFGTASMIGLEGHHVLNTVGDGGATEAFYGAVDLAGSPAGSSAGISIVGDGNGWLTWMEVSRIA